MSLFRELALAKGFSGGGNPNETETLVGTLESPFVGLSVEPSVLLSALEDRNASAFISLDASSVGLGVYVYPLINNGNSFYAGLTSIDSYTLFVSEAMWHVSGSGVELSTAFMADGEITTPSLRITDMFSYASVLPTTLTIYWHPMHD